MNVWKLIPYHVKDRRDEFAEWSRKHETIAIGWGGTGDLGRNPLPSAAEVKRRVAAAHPGFVTNSKVNGGSSLWRFHDEMQVGDLVIIAGTGPRKQTMRVTGEYYFVATGDDPTHYYEHRRKAQVVPVNSDLLWRAVNGVASGEGVYSTLVRCSRQLTEADVVELSD